jgi:hypothetical protein
MNTVPNIHADISGVMVMKASTPLTTLVAAALSVGIAAMTPAAAGAEDVMPSHGGIIAETGPYHIEWLHKDGTLIVYLMDEKGAAVAAKGMIASFQITAPEGKKGPFAFTAGTGNQLSAADVPEFPVPAKGIITLTDATSKVHQIVISEQAH